MKYLLASICFVLLGCSDQKDVQPVAETKTGAIVIYAATKRAYSITVMLEGKKVGQITETFTEVPRCKQYGAVTVQNLEPGLYEIEGTENVLLGARKYRTAVYVESNICKVVEL